MMPVDRFVLHAQAGVYLVTGLWSLVSRSTFERVTRPKTDYWLVQMVGLLAIVIGLALLNGAHQSVIDSPTRLLAIGSAGAFASIDLTYALRRRISRVYLLDAGLELAFVLSNALSWYASQSTV